VLVDKVRLDLLEVFAWMTDNGMTLNVANTQLIVIGNAANVARVGQAAGEY
jgi:hypothetical protein